MAIVIGTDQINAKFLGGLALNKIMLGVVEIFPNIGGTPAFSPSDWFVNGERGFFYNFNTLGDENLVLGAEMNPQVDFNSAAGWTVGSNMTIAGGALNALNTWASGQSSHALVLTLGKTYLVEVTVENFVGVGTFSVNAGNNPSADGQLRISGNGTYKAVLTNNAPAGAAVRLQVGNLSAAGYTFSITRLSCIEVLSGYQPTLFQVSNGQLNVVQATNPLGLVPDVKRPDELGPNLVVNGDFSSGSTGWTLDNGWSISGGVALANTNLGSERLGRTYLGAIGVSYLVTADITMLATPTNFASVGINIGGANQDLFVSTQFGLVGGVSYKLQGIAELTTATSFSVRVGSANGANHALNYTVDNISVREVPGNHITQPTAAQRPQFTGLRYNVQLSTEDFSGDLYRRRNLTATPRSGVAPDGTNTSNIIQLDGQAASANFDSFSPDHGANTNRMQRCSIHFKKGTLTNISIRYQTSTGPGSTYTIATGQITNHGSSIGIIEDLGGGWFRFSATAVKTNPFVWHNVFFDNGLTTTASCEVWGYQVENVESMAQPPRPYQRVGIATDFNDFGVNLALYDGVDDNLSTPAAVTISNNAYCYMCFGVIVRENAVFGMIAEYGASGEDGGFYVGCSATVLEVRFNGAGGTFYFEEYDLTAFNNRRIVIGIQTDRSRVLAAGAIVVTINGVVQTRTARTITIAGDATVYLPKRLFLGSRSGTSLRFNGQKQNVLFINRDLPPTERTQMETWAQQQLGILS